jgi:general secretion pathway protein I
MTNAEIHSPRVRCSARSSRGFTLLEVLAALIIVSLGMLGVIEAVSLTARNSSYVREKTIAHWIAMNQLTAVRLLPGAPKVDKSSDEVDMGGRRWRWTMEVSQTPVETMRRIDIRVRPEDADEETSLASVTGFYGTAASRQPGTLIPSWQGSDEDQPGPGGQDDDDKEDGDKDEPPSEQPVPPDPPEPTDPPMEDPPPTEDMQ